MPYIIAATSVAFWLGQDLSTGNISDIYMNGEVLQAARAGQFLAGLLTAPHLVPLTAYYTSGEHQASLNSYAGISDPFGVPHHQGLLPILLFAAQKQQTDESFGGWQAIGFAPPLDGHEKGIYDKLGHHGGAH